jgi:ATP-dependent RNA helicase DeaD
MLSAIEKATRQKIEPLKLPSTEMVNNKRIADFKQSISDTLAAGELDFMQSMVEQYQQEHDVPALEIAAALAKLSIGERQLLLQPDKKKPARSHDKTRDRPKPHKERSEPRQRKERGDKHPHKPQTKLPKGMERFRIEVGHEHEVKPANIVGAIANEAGLDARNIGHIDIHTDFSLVDLPKGMPREVFQDLSKARICGHLMKLSHQDEPGKKKKGGGHKPKKRKKTNR